MLSFILAFSSLLSFPSIFFISGFLTCSLFLFHDGYFMLVSYVLKFTYNYESLLNIATGWILLPIFFSAQFFNRVFSHVYATHHPALSVGPSVLQHFKIFDFLAHLRS